MTHLKWNKYSDVLSICSFFILTRIYVFLFIYEDISLTIILAADCLLCVNIEINITSNSPFNSNFNLLNVIFMFKEMSSFVKNAFNNVYPCISKIWTVSKLKLLITYHELRVQISNCEVRFQAPAYCCEWNFWAE